MTLNVNNAGWALAPARLARDDVRLLRQLYTTAHRGQWSPGSVAEVRLHVDRENNRKLALAKLGGDMPHVLVQATIYENNIVVWLFAVVRQNATVASGAGGGTGADALSMFALLGSLDRGMPTMSHKFQRRVHVEEWTRVLGRLCRHAYGVVAHLRTETLVRPVRPASRPSKVS